MHESDNIFGKRIISHNEPPLKRQKTNSMSLVDRKWMLYS